MDVAMWISAGAVLFVGSLVQRVTGMGLALVASPFLVLIMGATTGVQVVQVVGLGVCAASAWILRLDINRRKALILIGTSIVGLVPGAWLARTLPSGWLSIVIGGVTLVALVITLFIKRIDLLKGALGTGITGTVSGFMNVTAGVGGPPIVIYANTTRWKYVEYVATAQMYFVGVDLLSLVGRGFPRVSVGGWTVIVATAVGGIVLGNIVGSKIDETIARRAVLVVAFVGSLATVIRGGVALGA